MPFQRQSKVHIRNNKVSSEQFNYQFQQKLKVTLKHIQFSTRMTEKEFCDALGTTRNEYDRWLRGEYSLSIINLDSLSKRLALSIDLIYSGKIDFSTLSKQVTKDPISLPERYQNPAHQVALTRSLRSAVDYIGRFHGRQYASLLLSRLQIDPSFLYTDRTYISPLLQLDYIEVLKKESFGIDTIRDMGRYSAFAFKPLLKDQISSVNLNKSAMQTYEAFFTGQSGFFDLFFDHHLLRLGTNRCDFEMTLDPEKNSLFEVEAKKFSFSCQFKIGLTSSLLSLVLNRSAKYKEHSCWFKGDPSCRFELTW